MMLGWIYCGAHPVWNWQGIAKQHGSRKNRPKNSANQQEKHDRCDRPKAYLLNDSLESNASILSAGVV